MKINRKIKNFKKILLASLLLTALFSFFYNCKKTPTTPELPSYGSIQVNSTPTGATIWLDGSNTGKTTNALLTNISVGSHTIKLTKDCYKDFEITVSVQENQTEIVDTTLEESFSESGYTVSGIVYYSTTPLNGIKVELEKGSATGPTLQRTETINGFYSFSSVFPGRYFVKVFGPTDEYIRWTASSTEVICGDVTQDMDLPKKIILLSPKNKSKVSSLHPTLSWKANNEARRYTIQINVTDGWELVEMGNSTTHSYTVESELTPGVNYTWQVDAYEEYHWVGTTCNAFRFTVSTSI